MLERPVHLLFLVIRARAVKAKAMLVAKAGEMAQLEAALHVVSSDGFAMHAELVALRQLCVRLGAHPDRVRRTRRQQLSTSIASSRGRALYTGSNNDGIDGASVLRSPGATLRAAHAASVAAQEAARCAHTSLGTAATDEAAAAERRRAATMRAQSIADHAGSDAAPRDHKVRAAFEDIRARAGLRAV